MALTAQTAQAHIEHALAGPSEIEPLEILNQAGRFVTGMRNWKWLRGAKTTLDLVSGQEFVNLPADCKRVDAVQQTDSIVGTIEYVPLLDFLQYKTSTVTVSPITFWCTTVYARDTFAIAGTEKPGEPTMRLELYPTPTASATAALTMYYARKWYELEENNQEITLPTFMEALYIAACRAFALGYEEENAANADMRLGALAQGVLYGMAVKEDSQVQPSYGQLRGGMAEPGVVIHRWSGAVITGP